MEEEIEKLKERRGRRKYRERKLKREAARWTRMREGKKL